MHLFSPRDPFELKSRYIVDLKEDSLLKVYARIDFFLLSNKLKENRYFLAKKQNKESKYFPSKQAKKHPSENQYSSSEKNRKYRGSFKNLTVNPRFLENCSCFVRVFSCFVGLLIRYVVSLFLFCYYILDEYWISLRFLLAQ